MPGCSKPLHIINHGYIGNRCTDRCEKLILQGLFSFLKINSIFTSVKTSFKVPFGEKKPRSSGTNGHLFTKPVCLNGVSQVSILQAGSANFHLVQTHGPLKLFISD